MRVFIGRGFFQSAAFSASMGLVIFHNKLAATAMSQERNFPVFRDAGVQLTGAWDLSFDPKWDGDNDCKLKFIK